MIWPFAILIGLCLAAEAFFAGAEVALVSADRSRLRRRAEAGSIAARQAIEMLERPERLLSTTLIGTSLSAVAASFAANEMFARRFGPELSVWAIALMIPLILLFGEILPKSAARRRPDAVALRLAPPLRLAMIALAPAVVAASAAARLLARPFRARGCDTSPVHPCRNILGGARGGRQPPRSSVRSPAGRRGR